ncbi:hypothetical protein AGMMS50222_10060 [Endomicrobiia bacterium]|nr:hypothetical protein AGMMS49556_00600 [Endomicrobiia bacterium]GHT76883.1 hypothetical protein AGMMS50222_10060 [Endomicrobiia bacterium]
MINTRAYKDYEFLETPGFLRHSSDFGTESIKKSMLFIKKIVKMYLNIENQELSQVNIGEFLVL